MGTASQGNLKKKKKSLKTKPQPCSYNLACGALIPVTPLDHIHSSQGSLPSLNELGSAFLLQGDTEEQIQQSGWHSSWYVWAGELGAQLRRGGESVLIH